jgi:hypothetical protein
MISLRSCGPLAYSDNECAKQLLYALDDSIWGMKITVLEESADFATLDTENYLVSLNLMNCLGKIVLTMMLLLLVLVLVAMMLTPPTPLSHLLWSALSSLAVVSDEQYESIPDDEITLLARKF